MYHMQQAAILGCDAASYNLGCVASNNGEDELAIKHWVVVAGCGCKTSLANVQQGYIEGVATKVQYETALRDYQAYTDAVKSVQRDNINAYMNKRREAGTLPFGLH